MTGVFFGIAPVCLYDKLYNRDDGDVLRDVAIGVHKKLIIIIL